MSKNTELLSGFLTCMIKLTDKLHATNNKLVDHSLQIVDLSGKLENLNFSQTSGNIDASLSSKLDGLFSYITNISGTLDDIILSGTGSNCQCGDIERFIDESELSSRLDELEIKDIDVNDKELIDLVNNLNNDLNYIISGSNISLRDELAIIHAKINKLSGLLDDQVICGGVVDPNIERFIDESELSTHLSYFDSKFIDEDEMDQRLNNLDLSNINIGDGSLLDDINKLKDDIK
jgi:hypothetical protein